MRFHILLVAIFATAASASDDQDREERLDKLTFMHWNNKLPESVLQYEFHKDKNKKCCRSV